MECREELIHSRSPPPQTNTNKINPKNIPALNQNKNQDVEMNNHDNPDL